MIIDLADLDIEEDPGTNWHPRTDKTEVWDQSGRLVDLDEDQAAEHAAKPEADEQYDGVRHRARVGRELGSAEDSDHSPTGVV